MKFKTRNKLLTFFTFASLTDIVLLLLIFFLLTSSFIAQSGIKIHLPRAETREQISSRNIFITLTADGKIYLFTDKITKDSLKVKLDELSAIKGDRTVILRADRSVPIQSVIDVMDIARSSGFKKFIVATQLK
jgi:biopolymer transport protein ExbD